ncbi:MAG: alpha-L-rhamnosidase C-terminal domain-containing protein [Gemmatimonadota bacterium]|nr:alpha-L-rhamnosidase C-terminal domain-containing protein [Gemmatimonadota bacterium]
MLNITLSKMMTSVAGVVLLAVFAGAAFIFQGCAAEKTETIPPSGLMCELMEYPERTVINDARPEFCWIVNSPFEDDLQSAYQIILATDLGNLNKNIGDMWDTGKIVSGESINIEYNGKPLLTGTAYFWKVRTWNKRDEISPYSTPQRFRTGRMEDYATARYPLEKHEIEPLRVVKKGAGHYFVDFGKAAFGTVKLTLTSTSTAHEMEIHLGEAPAGENAVNRKPGGSIRYRKIVLPLKKGTHTYPVSITPDQRNTGKRAIRMPGDIGEVMPFRYCEIVNSPSDLDQSMISQVAVNYHFNDKTSLFISSSKVLNDVWELCKYSIKATSFCGVYVDGDRERIPYEADAYLNQLCHYCVDREFTMARYSHEYLITHPTWPTEWILHSVLMAWADYLYTGNAESIEKYYEDLKAKTLLGLARADGLISTKTPATDEILKSIHFSGRLRDIVDWPRASFGGNGVPGERDGYVFTDINTVVNAFHYQALVLMSRIAGELQKKEDADFFRNRAELVEKSINEKLFDTSREIYIDGKGTDHASLHANMFPLAFGLVPKEYVQSVTDFIKTRGMACSVYGAQYLLEALYRAGEADYALSLMTSTSERSWAHMIFDVGTTITLEAWDSRYKPNLDWNHAWGAAPANIIPRLLMGIQPLDPGFGRIQIKPQPGGLESGSLDLPTIRGTVHVDFKSVEGAAFFLNIRIPANTKAKVYLPRLGIDNSVVTVDGVPRKGMLEGDFVVLDNIGSGEYRFERHQ